MGQGGDARRELGQAGPGDVGREARRRRRRAARTRICSGSPRRCSTAAASGARRTRSRATASTSYRLDYPKGLGEAKWKLAYPRAFPALVAKNTKANQLPEALQLAIMREESAFSPRIESFANAIGLTQMLVKTAKRFANGAHGHARGAARSGQERRDRVALPRLPVEALRRARAPLAIAGYNAGEAAVDRWLGERGDLAMDEFMETIPYDETRNYTKRVLASYFTYSWLYGKQPVPTLPLGGARRRRRDRDGDRGAGAATRDTPTRARTGRSTRDGGREAADALRVGYFFFLRRKKPPRSGLTRWPPAAA